MNNRIEEAQKDGTGQDEIEVKEGNNENSNFAEMDVTAEQSGASTSDEYQIETQDAAEEETASHTDATASSPSVPSRSEEHTSELQSRQYLVCRLLLEKKQRSEKHTSEIQSRQYLV